MTTMAKMHGLPPCRVCNGPGNGFHYGVNTCDGCKGFFHRGLTQNTKYKCKRQNRCVIQHGKGRLCQLCRFKKCLAVGMSKEAIKTGRYTSSKRAEFIIEVKMLEEGKHGPDRKSPADKLFGESTNIAHMELSEATLDEDNVSEGSGPSKSRVSSTSMSNFQINLDCPSVLLSPKTESPTLPKDSEPMEICSSNPSPSYVSNLPDTMPNLEALQYPFTPNSTQACSSETSYDSPMTTMSADLPLMMTCQNEFCSQYSNDVMTQVNTKYIMDLFADRGTVLQVLMEAHEKALKDHFWTPEELLRETKTYYEYCKSRLETFGHLNRLQDEEYNHIYERTGIDVDGRQGSFKKFGDGIEGCTRRMITFIKPVPGFRDLELEDQTNLLKNNRLEFAFLCNYMFANIELGVIACFSGHWNCLLEATNQYKYKVSKAYIDLCARLQSLHLTEEERMILKAMSVMNPDRGQLKQPDLIYQIHWNLTEMLLFSLGQRHERPHLLFAEIIDVLTNFRNIEEGIKDCVKSWNISQFTPIQNRPLLEEMVSGFYIPSNNKTNSS